MGRVFSLFLSLGIALNTPFAGAETAAPQSILSELKGRYENSSTLEEFIAPFQKILSADDMSFLKSHITPAVWKSRSILRVQSRDSFTMDGRGQIITVKVLSFDDQIFEINHVRLDLYKDGLRERNEKISAVLPKIAVNSGLWSLIFPDANAIPVLGIIATIAIISLAITAAGMVHGAGQCRAMKAQIEPCSRRKEELRVLAYGREKLSEELLRFLEQKVSQAKEGIHDGAGLCRDDRLKLKSCVDDMEESCVKLGCHLSPGSNPPAAAGNANR
jgi:hypothetical protein